MPYLYIIITICFISLALNIAFIWMIQRKKEDIEALAFFIELQDQIVTEYREKFGDIKIDFSEKKE